MILRAAWVRQADGPASGGRSVKKKERARDLTDAALIERAWSMANDWAWAVALQCDRLSSPRKADAPFSSFGNSFSEADIMEADVHFLAIALRRLRRCAELLRHVPSIWPSVQTAIEDFDRALPQLNAFRNAFEHLEDYAIDEPGRHHKEVSRRDLQVWTATSQGLEWKGGTFDAGICRPAAERLLGAMKAAIRPA